MNRHSFASLLLLLAATPASAQLSTTALLDTVQHTAFNFFWNEANPANGLIKDRANFNGGGNAPCSIASVGFGLTAICIGVDHGWVTRQAARDRVLTTLNTFWFGTQGNGTNYIGNFGLFFHFLDMGSATRTWNSELSTIDTGLLLAGIVDVKQYFTGTDSTERRIRNLSDSIYYRMNWDLMRNFNPGILMGWNPGTGFGYLDAGGHFVPYSQWVGYNEASIMYILAMGSPTYPVGSDGWAYWCNFYLWANQYGYTYVNFAPLFGHQYSQCWLDLRGLRDQYMRDKGIDYFENSRRATYAQRAYATANPGGHKGYSDSLWGITASDVPTGYAARGAPPAENDDGTITPTAPVSSIAFAPEIVLPVIRNMWTNYPQLWGKYGFRDAFNLDVNWYDTDVIGIDQGPMIIMIENYRTGSVWKRFMKNPDVQRGLQAAGFQPVTGVNENGNGHAPDAKPLAFTLEQNFPNPFNPGTAISFTFSRGAKVRLAVYDMLGRELAVLVDGEVPPGRMTVMFDGRNCPSGTYFYRLEAEGKTAIRKMVIVK